MTKKTFSDSAPNTQRDTSPSGMTRKMAADLRPYLIMYILKTLSNSENQLTSGMITDYLSNLTYMDYDSKTIRRSLSELTEAMEYFEENAREISDAVCFQQGGRLRVTIPGKSQKRYYFEPFADKSDISMICGSILSNHYLSADEKAYLTSMLLSLHPFVDLGDTKVRSELQHIPALAAVQRPRPVKSSRSPVDSNLQLSNISTIYKAISSGTQIRILYGHYSLSEDGQSTRLTPEFRPNEKDYVLNPYALVWNNGRYYLIATVKGQTNPIHYRVDRILYVKNEVHPEDSRINIPREDIPDSLKPYFRTVKNRYRKSSPEFLSDMYTADFPLMMSVFAEDEFIDAVLECTERTLSILMDYFGTDMEVIPSPVDHGDMLDYNGKPPKFLCVRIKHVQYNNILLFCLQKQATVTDSYSPIFALHPKRLADDIRDHLEKSRKHYEAYMAAAGSIPHPFISNTFLGE